jgi:hypothetical protein
MPPGEIHGRLPFCCVLVEASHESACRFQVLWAGRLSKKSSVHPPQQGAMARLGYARNRDGCQPGAV